MIWLAPGEPETIEATYEVSSAILQDGRASYDAAGRMASYADWGAGGIANANLSWKYDAAGNIRNVNAAYKAINADGSFASYDSTQSYWYKYDALNRMVTTKGVLNGTPGSGTISRGSEGSDIAYDAAGQRATMTTGATPKLETYSYNAMGYLTKVSIQINGGTVRDRATYARDLLGRVTDYVEYDNAGTLVHARGDVEYNKRDQVLLEKTRTKQGSDWIYTHTVNYYTETGAAMAQPANIDNAADIGTSTGTILAFTETKNWKNGSSNPVYGTPGSYSQADLDYADSYVTNLYNWYDSAVQANIVYVNRDGTTNAGYQYDGNGSLIFVDQNGGNRPRDITFVTDAQGRVLSRSEADNNYSQSDPRQRYYRFNGIDMGTIGNNGSDNVDFDASIALRTQAAPTNPGAFRGGATTGTPFADFDMSYDAINGTSEAMVASYYTVRNGDTLATIAQTVWGDASLWYMFAEANGLSGTGGLVAGTGIIIPEKGSNFRNSADTFRPYDPQAAIGDTQPGAPKPPKQSNKCGTFGIILMIAVAVAVAAVVGPQVAAAFSTTVTTTATSAAIITTTGATIANTVVATYSTLSAAGAIAAGAVTAAAASVASQAFGAITGIQKNFSFKQVALSAISGGISAGIGQIPGLSGGGFANGAARGALSNAATQGISVATGLQNKFSWTGVAVGGGVGGVSSALDAQFARTVPDRSLAQYAQQTLTGGAAAIAGAATRSLLDGSDFGDNLVAALPDVIGSTIGNMVAKGVDERSRVSGGGSSGDLEVDGFRIRQSNKASPFSAYVLNASSALTDDLTWDGARRSSNGPSIVKPLIEFTVDSIGRASRDANVQALTESDGWSFESIFNSDIVVNGWKRFTNFVSSLSSQQSADRITRSIMTTINRNVANPLKANVTNIISKSVSVIQSSADRLSQNLQSGTDWLLHTNEKYAQNQLPGQRELTIFTTNAAHTILSGFAQLPGAIANPSRTISGAFWSSAEATDSFLRMNDTPARISIPAAANRLANSSSDDLARGGGKLVGNVAMAITPMELAAGARMSSFGKSGYVITAKSVPLNTRVLLQGVTDRAVAELAARPGLARELMSPGSYNHLVERTRLAPASYGKAVERLSARMIRDDPALSSILSHQSWPFKSTPDFIGHEGYNMRMLDITTAGSAASHTARSYGSYTEIVTHQGLPSNLVFSR